MSPEDKKKLDDVHLAICGNPALGVDGLVEDVRALKKFRRGIELKTATIGGGAAVVVLALKAVWSKISG